MSRTPRTLWIKAIRKCDGRCWFCGEEAKTVDHATPRYQGGGSTLDNLLPACIWCNNTKDSMTVSQFRKYLKALLARYLMGIAGFAATPNLHKRIEIVFYGENNTSPLDFKAIESFGRVHNVKRQKTNEN